MVLCFSLTFALWCVHSLPFNVKSLVHLLEKLTLFGNVKLPKASFNPNVELYPLRL